MKKKKNATTLPPRRVEKTAIAQLTASEESFNSLKLGCRELWSLVSARSDVPDLFQGILENAVSTSLVEAPSVQAPPPHVGQDLRSDLQKTQEKLKNQKEAP